MSLMLKVKRDHDAITLLASTTTAAGAVDSQGAAVYLPGMVRAYGFVLDLTNAATDVGDTLDVKVQTKIDGTNWLDVVHFTQILGNGSNTLRFIEKCAARPAFAGFEVGTALTAGNVRDLLGDVWRVKYDQVDADTDASFTFSVTACPM